MPRWIRFGIVGVAACAVAVLVVLAVGMLTGVHAGVSAKPLPRGVLLSVPDKPAVLNRPAVEKKLDGVRAEIKLPAMSVSACLDGVARSLAASFNTGAVPTTTPATCGHVDWGWVAGADPTGAQQAGAAYGRTPTGPSPLVAKSARRLGLAVGPWRESGVLTGYVLVWVVAA
jgi:hypothetical protein